MQYDIYFISFRVTFTFISALLYCPDYFEFLISTFDEELVLTLKTDSYKYRRDTFNVIAEYITGFSGLIQLFMSYFTRNPIILGLHFGEVIGQLIFIVQRSIFYSVKYLAWGSEHSRIM